MNQLHLDLIDAFAGSVFDEPIAKHGTHDQKTHGSWANGVGENWTTRTEKGRTIFSQDRGSKLLEVSISNKNLANPKNKKDFEAALSTIDTLNDAFPIRGSVNFGVSDLGEEGRIASTWSTVMEFGVTSPAQAAQISLGHEWFNVPKDIQTHTLAHEWGHANDFRPSDVAKSQADNFSEARFQDSKIPMTDYGMSSNREAYAEAFAVKFNNSHKGGIYSGNVEQTPRWEDVFKIFELGSVNKSADASVMSFRVWDTFDANNPPKLIEDYDPIVQKHGTHDQKTHGSWATGSEGKVLTSLIDRLAEKKTPGFSIDIRTKKSPKTGYMCSIDGAERQVKLDKWNSVDNDGKRAIIEQYKKDNMGALSKRGAYFGAWKVVQDGVIYLDVSRRYESKSEGISAGTANRQKSIYDIVKDAYIYMEDENDGTRANKARTGGVGQTSERDDSRGIGRADGRNPDGDRGQSVSFPHVCLGRYSVVGIQKHLEGQHDQATHGNWAGDRYPADSVKSARDGAKEYAFKKGLNPDETIDYTKVVANRERASKIADIYESLPKMDRDAVDEYEALASEVEEQFNYMTKTLGVKVEFVTDDPYKTSKEMFNDVSNGSLKVLSTATTGAHPIFSDEQNNKFRAVHDYFGHAATGRGFGQDGEESAWVHHSQMFTEKARAALTTETRGQNSFFNNRGKQFADQKVALLPEEFWAVPKVFQKGYQVIYFAPGLKPVLKHSGGEAHGGGDDQSSHGNWAGEGYTEEESQRIADMAELGPSIEDLNSMLDGAPVFDHDELRTFVANDSALYDQATDGIDERVQQEINNRAINMKDTTEEQKNRIYESIKDQMISEYIDNDDGTIRQLLQEASGYEGIDSDTATMFFNDVYALNHTGVGRTGESREFNSEISMTEIYSNQGIMVRGDVLDENNESVAGIERTFTRDANGVWNVKHDYFMFNEERDKGTGFGKVFLQQSEDWYTARGFGSISLYTAAEGAVHWARQGFDFDEKHIENNLTTLARNFPTDNPKFVELMQRATNRYNPRNGSFDSVKPMTTDRFPTPAEFALIGYRKGATDWMGGNAMYGMRLDYKKTLTAEGRNLISGGGLNNITGYYETAGSENPVDRDGDGLVFDGTAREKPVPKKTK